MSALNLDTYSLSLITAKEDILSARTSTDCSLYTYREVFMYSCLYLGGLEELTEKLNKNLVQYGLCQVSDPNTGVRRVILIHWVGENVDTFQRDVAAKHLPFIRKFFKEVNVLLAAQKVEDITQEMVAQALSRVPEPTKSFQKPTIPRAHEVVGTKYMKTNPAVEMKISKRQAFWERSEREEERRKEMERLRLQEERIVLERERIERERLEEEDRERRIQEKERLVEEQRKEKARLEAERRKLEKERWAQQQKEYDEELRGRFKRSQSIEMAAEAAVLVSSRSLHPRDFFRQQERSASISFSPPSTPSSPSKSSLGFFNRTTLRYQRSMTESILSPTNRSPTFFQGFQKRDSFSSPSASSPQTCSPAFIFSKSPLPGTSPKVDSLPSFIPPPITTTRMTPTQVKGIPPPSDAPPRTGSDDLTFRAKYITISTAEHNASALNTKAQARPQHQDLNNGENLARSGGLYRAELVSVESPSTFHSEVQDLPNKQTKSPTNVTAVKAAVSASAPVTKVAFTCPAPASEAKKHAAPQRAETVLPILPSSLRSTQPATSAADINTPTPIAQVSSAALSTQEGINKATNIKFHSIETVLSTNSASSYEPKMFPASTSLVSLLAPIPYTPYRTQRSDSTLRSSSSASLSGNAPPPSLETPTLVTLSCRGLEASLSFAVDSSKISPECKYPLPGEFTQDPSTKTSSPSPVFPSCGCSAEFQLHNIQANILIPDSSSPLIIPIEISAEYQSNTIQADNLLPELSLISPSLPAESSVEPQLNNIQPDIPLAELSHEPPFITTAGSFGQLNVQADIPFIDSSSEPSCTTIKGSSRPQLDSIQADIPLVESSHKLPYVSTEGCSGPQINIQTDIPLTGSSSGPLCTSNEESSGPQLSNIQTIIPVIEPSSEPPSTTTESASQLNIQVDIPLVESSSKPSYTITEGFLSQLNVKSDIPLMAFPSESSCTTTKGSYGPQFNNIQADIPLVEPSHKLPSVITEGCSGPPINIQTDIPLTESSSEPSSTSTEGSSEPKLSNIQTIISLIEPTSEFPSITTKSSCQSNDIRVDIPLVESSHEPLPITTKSSSGQVNVQADILLMESSESLCTSIERSSAPQLNILNFIPLIESSSEHQSTTTKGSSQPNNNDIRIVELSYEPISIITEDSSGQLNIKPDIPLMESPSEPSCATTKSSSGLQLNNIQADIPLVDPSHEAPSITTEGSSQLNFQAAIPFTEPSSGSSSPLPDSLIELQSINVPTESSPEPPSIDLKGCSGPQLENAKVDSPLQEPLLGAFSSLATESSSGPRLKNIHAESLPELLSITSEGSSVPQLNNSQADTPLAETSFLSPSFPTEGSGKANITNQDDVLLLGSYPIYTSLQSSREPQVTNIQADTQLLEFLPVLFLPFESSIESQPEHIQPIALSPESFPVSPSLQTTISCEPHPEGTLTDIPLMGFSPASSSQAIEDFSESQPRNIQSDIKLIEFLPIYSSIPTSPAEHKLRDIQPDIELEKSLPPSTERSTESQLAKTDFLQPELPFSIFTTLFFPESQLHNNKSDTQSLESTAASSVSSTENPPESHAIEVQTDHLVEESSFSPFYVPTNVSSEPELNNMEADIPPQEPPHAPRTEAQPNVQTDLLLKRSSFIEGFSPITIDCSTDALPHEGQEDITLIETSPVSSYPLTENPSDFQPSNNENGNQLFSSSAVESLPNVTQTKEPLTESSLVSTCPTYNTLNFYGKPNSSQSGVPSDEISLLPFPLLEAFPNQSLADCILSDRSPKFPLRSSFPSCETVYTEKVIFSEDPHSGSPPVNGNLIALESRSIDDPGDLEVKSAGNVLHNPPVLDVQSSNNITVDEDPASDPKLIPCCEQVLLRQFNSNSSEAFF
ncbi:hypothetical protein PRIEUP_LOCUS16239 [Pristimantis euphronides]